jgi:putative protease
MNNLELLAPAGDFEKLKYALSYGADAVYAGMPQYSLRARENGFTTAEDIRKGIEYCHAQGKKFYLTSNIIPHNNKIRAYREALDEFISYKPDALIMTDPGLIAYVRDKHPDMDIHLSVQANRVILSREMRLREILEIHEAVPELEIEVFVHGAICMAHSGRCMLSNYMNYRDANQGACSNACRFKYEMYQKNEPQGSEYTPIEGQFFIKEVESPEAGFMEVDEDEYGTYFMNSKDMCAIGVVDKLAKAGVISFKVEGRTKSLYYLSQVCKSYRGALDDVEVDRPIADIHIDNALKTDSRGYMPGYFVAPGDLPQNYESTRVISPFGVVSAQVMDYDNETKELLVDVKGQIKVGDKLEIFSPSDAEEFTVTSLKGVRGNDVDVINPGLKGCRIAYDKKPGETAMIIKNLSPIKPEAREEWRALDKSGDR